MATPSGFKVLGKGSNPGPRWLAGVGRRTAGRSSRGFGAPTPADWQKAPPSPAIANAAIALLTSHEVFGSLLVADDGTSREVLQRCRRQRRPQHQRVEHVDRHEVGDGEL